MTCYVDNMEAKLGRMIFCHFWADTLDEMLAMVDKIGVQRKWIQGHPTLSLPRYRKASWCHFDIVKSKRALAIKAGAVVTDRYQPAIHCAELRLKGIDPNSFLPIKLPPDALNANREHIERLKALRATRDPCG